MGKEAIRYNYNALNEGLQLIIRSNQDGHAILTANVDMVKNELWDTILDPPGDGTSKKVFSSFYKTVHTDNDEDISEFFKELSGFFSENLKMLEWVIEDRSFSKKKHHYRYYHNGQRLVDSFYVPYTDMNSAVEFKEDEEGIPSMYVISDSHIPSIAYSSGSER